MIMNSCNTLEADFVVLGIGTAGSVFVKELSDIPNVSVIGVEAGPNFGDDPLIINPVTFFPLVNLNLSAIYMYQQQDLPNPNANNRTFQYTMGRGLGGGSSVNGGLWVKSQKETWAEWEALAGPLWSPDNVYKNINELETYNGETPCPSCHGYNGPINIRQPTEFTEVSADWADSMAAVSGLPHIPLNDYNNQNAPPTGVFNVWQLTQYQDKTRGSGPRYFLGPDVINFKDSVGYGVNGRKLLIFTQATAVKLIYKNKKSNKAVAVEIIHNGICKTIYARKEIIISMGIHSAEFLQRSGVGPIDVLNNAGVPVKFSNPNVGENMVVKQQLLGVSFALKPGQTALPPDDPQAIYVAGAFLPADTPGADPNLRAFHSLTTPQGNTFGFNGVLLKPKSRGRLRIQSPDPFQVSLVENGMLSDPNDLATIRAFIRRYVPGMIQQLNVVRGYPIANNPYAGIDIFNDDQLDNVIRNTINLNFELWQCSCRMSNNPFMGVADGHGRVYGIKNVRVGDASASPVPTDGVPQAVAYVIGHILTKDIIKSLYEKIPKCIPKRKKCYNINKKCKTFKIKKTKKSKQPKAISESSNSSSSD